MSLLKLQTSTDRLVSCSNCDTRHTNFSANMSFCNKAKRANQSDRIMQTTHSDGNKSCSSLLEITLCDNQIMQCINFHRSK